MKSPKKYPNNGPTMQEQATLCYHWNNRREALKVAASLRQPKQR